MRALLSLIVALWSGAAAADTGFDAEAEQRFLEREACAIGPSSVARAATLGFDAAAFAEAALAAGHARQVGDWVVWAPEQCQIKLPEITSEISLDDVEVQDRIKVWKPEDDVGDVGCFITGTVYETLQVTRGWSADRAFKAYIQLIAKGIIDGTIRFYSDSPLATPPGFKVLVGARCEGTPNAPEIVASHGALIDNFELFLEVARRDMACEHHSLMTSLRLDDETTNAWVLFEADMILMGAGWHAGMTARERGRLRPSLCRQG